MQTTENHLKILQLINQQLHLPSPPAIAVRILNAVQKDDSALTELGEIIATDPVLTAKMLRVANSEFFARQGQISNINRAMAVLGTNLIKNIALSFIIASELEDTGASRFDVNALWRRSVTAAVSADLLATLVNQKDDDIFVTALLQDIGMLVIAQTKGDHYNKLCREASLFDQSLSELEKDSYGFDHQQVGYALLQSWQLPENICCSLLFHHEPEQSPDTLRTTVDILHYAAQLAELYTSPCRAEKARHLQQELTDRFALSHTQTAQLLDDAAVNSRNILASFELDPGDLQPYSILLQQANQELADLNMGNAQMILELQDARDKAERLARELQDANNRLRELVYRDGLTGLYNHRYFQEALKYELSRAARYKTSVSLILFDIDYFKKVNDSHGHPAGDVVLMNIARAVSSAVRPTDIVARYGGEEFAVILPETNAAGAKVFAARLRRCVEGIATLVDGQLIYVTVSAGATTFGADCYGISKDDLIETADRGLYHSKKNGRNQVTVLELETPPR